MCKIFRLNCSSAEQIFTCWCIIEKCWQLKVSAAISFIDLIRLMTISTDHHCGRYSNSYQFPEKVVKVVECIYKNSSCCSWTNDGHSHSFQVLSGVHQGCILPFAIAIDWALKEEMSRKGMKWHMGRNLSDIDFANDIARSSNSTHDLQELVSNISEIAASLGLSISCKKTKNMLIGQHPTPSDVSTGQNKMEVTENFIHLGHSITNQGAKDHEIINRIGKASAAFSQLKGSGQARSGQ